MARLNGKTIALDLALSTPEEGKALMVNIAGTSLPPTYQPDWKQSDSEAANLYKQPAPHKQDNHQPGRQLIVRTAIVEGEMNAKEGALFSLDCISPENTVWCADIDFSAIEDAGEKKQAQALMAKVLTKERQDNDKPEDYKLQGIGKTKAHAILTQQEQFLQTQTVEKCQGYYIITLQTPGRLFSAPNSIKAISDAESLKTCYQQYWQDISANTLTLSHYYAQQSKVGGEFYWRYYQQGEAYQPEWLTTAGSVFVLTANESFDETLLSDWLKWGLPQATDKKDSDWSNNPYIRENGFAEIRLNDAIHTTLSLQAQKLSGEWL